MRLRFVSFIALGVTAAFLVVASTSFTRPTIDALALGVSIGVLVVSTALAVRFREHLATAAASLAAGVVSVLMIVASQVADRALVKDLTFVEGLALGAIALAGLAVHELTSERVVHSLELRAEQRRPQQAPVA